MKKILILIGFLYSINSFSQSTVLLRGDTIKVYKQGGDAVLKVEGHLMLKDYRQGNSNDSVLTWDATTKKVRMMDRSSFGSSGGLGVLDTLVNPKWSVVQDAAGDTYKSHAPSVFYAADFGVKADGVTDDWTALDSCLRYVYDHGGGVVIPPLGKIITSRVIRFPLDDVDAGSANLRSIRLIGQATPNMYSNPLAPSNHPQYGTIIEATFLGDSAIIDTRYTGVSWGNFNLLNIGVENISLSIRSKTAGVDVAAQGQGINAQHMAFFQAKNISISTTSEIYNSVQPASTSAGILFPANNNGAIVNADNIFVTGVYYAGMAFEHANIDNWFSDACYYGFYMNIGNHSIHINRICVARCAITIGTGNDSRFKIDNLSIEDKLSGGLWFDNTLDLEAGATATGEIHYQRVETILGGVNNDVFTRTNNAYNITCLPIGENIPKWATGNRPDIIPEAATIIGYNTDSSRAEVYDHPTSSWLPVNGVPVTPSYCDHDLGLGLRAYWDFEESTGNFLDKSGNAKDLTRFNSAATITGKVGNGEGNTGASSQYVKTSVGTGLSAGVGFTWAGWVKLFNTADPYQVITQKGIGASFNFEYNIFQNAGNCYFSLSTDGTNPGIVSVNKPLLRDSVWHFIVGKWDGATMSLSIDNGTAATASIGAVYSGSSVLYLGSDATPSLYLTGGIDEVGIWNTALSAGDITALYNSGTGRTIGTEGGGVLFAGDDCSPSHDLQLHWDNTNKSLGVGTNVPSTKSVLDLTSTTKGFLPPRMTTTQRNAIASPVVGLLIWNTTDSTLQQYRGLSGWASFGGGGTPTLTSTQIAYGNGSNLMTSEAGLSYNETDEILTVSNAIKTAQFLTPDFNSVGTPASGFVSIFSDNHGRVYSKNDAATVVELTNPSLTKSAFDQNPTSADTIDVWQTPVAITITSLKAILRGTSPSVTYNIAFGTNIQSPTAVFTADITCTSVTTGCSNSSGFNDATIPAGSFIWIYTTAASGTIRSIAFTINYTED